MPEATGECPVRAAHMRLMDCHVHWHALAEKYMDPEGFRLQLNSLIQDLRNVTWVLQKQKARLPDFATWYGEWKESVSDDPVMAWVVKARNRIVKEADLELHSEARVRYSKDWLSGYETTLTLPPRFSTRQLMHAFVTARPADVHSGLLSIERRWVENRLPTWEVLQATAHVYDRLASVVWTAHAGVDNCALPPRDRSCVTSQIKTSLGCMRISDEDRRLDFDLGENQEIIGKYVHLQQDHTIAEKARERYGEVDIGGDAVERVPQALERAKTILVKDKAHITVAWLLRGDQTVDLYPLMFYNQTSKRLAMQKLADYVERTSADGIVLIAESWIAVPGPDEDLNDPNIVRPEHRPDRQEAIMVEGITRDGRTSASIAVFSRDREGNITFDETVHDVGGQINYLEPILRKWRIST